MSCTTPNEYPRVAVRKDKLFGKFYMRCATISTVSVFVPTPTKNSSVLCNITRNNELCIATKFSSFSGNYCQVPVKAILCSDPTETWRIPVGFSIFIAFQVDWFSSLVPSCPYVFRPHPKI